MYTSCPECGTVYRLTTVQLRVAEGQVRCGNCSAVFNALASLSDEAPVVESVVEPAMEPPVTGPPAPPPAPQPVEDRHATQDRLPVEGPAGQPAAATEPAAAIDDVLEFNVPEDHWSKFFGTPAAAHTPIAADGPVHRAPDDEPDDPPHDEPDQDPDEEPANGSDYEPEDEPEDDPEDEPGDSVPFVLAHFDAEDWQALLDEVGDEEDAHAEPVYVIGQDSPFGALQPIGSGNASGTTIDDDPAEIPIGLVDEAPETPLETVPHDIGEVIPGNFGGPGPDFDPGMPPDHAIGDLPAADSLHFDVFTDTVSGEEPELEPGPVFASALHPQFDEPESEREPEPERETDFDPALRPARDNAGLADVLAEQPFAWRPETAQPPESRRGRYFAIGSVLLALLLAGQFIHRQRDALAAHPFWGPQLTRAYQKLGVVLHPAWNLSAYEVRASEAVVGRTAPGALDISARIGIVGTDAVGLPLLRVTLRDRRANIISSGIFEPEDYLLGDEALPDGLLTPGLVFPVRISVADPGTEANGYEVDICIRMRDRAVHCQRDADPFRS